MALADSLVFPDLLVSITLIIIILILTIYLTNLLLKLSVIDYRVSIGTYLFTECQSGNLTGITDLNHVMMMSEVTANNYLIICPRISVNNSRLSVEVYVAYVR